MLETIIKLWVKDVFLGKTFFAQKIWEMSQKWGFLNLNKNFVVNIHWIYSIMKIYIISFVHAQFQFSQSDCKIFKSAISPEQMDETVSYFECWCKFSKIKSWSIFLWLVMIKNECGQSGLWTLILTLSQEGTDGRINSFFACWYKLTQIKKWLKILRWAQSKMGVANLSQDSNTDHISKMNRWNKLLFACR